MLDTATGIFVCMRFVIYYCICWRLNFICAQTKERSLCSCYSVDRHIQRYMPGQDCWAYTKPNRVPNVFWTGSDGQYQFVNSEVAISLRFHFEMSAYAPKKFKTHCSQSCASLKYSAISKQACRVLMSVLLMLQKFSCTYMCCLLRSYLGSV